MNTTIAILPWYQAVEPFILAIWGTVIAPALVIWLATQFQARTNIRVSDQAKAAIQQAAVNAAGRILAGQEGNVAALKFDVHSPLIAAEVTKMQTSVGPSLDKLGVTPDRVADLVAAKIGILQSSAMPQSGNT